MSKYKAYSEYKDSGVEWLGEIPIHWDSKPLKFLCTCNDQVISDSTGKDYELEYVDIGSVSSLHGITKTENMIFSKSPSRARRLVQDGDVIISTVRTYLEAIAPIINPPTNMVVSTGFAVIRPLSHLNKKFAAYCLRASGFIKEVVAHSVGVSYPAINASDLIGIPIPSCALPEQSKIAEFLDHETAKIDNLIEKQKQLIELLKEKRQAVISHAVTKGLNPDVLMKDSGVEWLGEMPEHWDVTKLKYECSHIVDCPHSTPSYNDDGDFPAIRTADIFSGYLDLEKCRRVTKSVYDERNFRLIPKAGDIIYSREGERFGIGAAIPENARVCLAQRVMLFRAKSTAGYLMWALNSSSTYNQAQQDCIGSTSPHVNVDTIKNFILAWPSKNERVEIASFINQISSSIELLTLHLTKKLELLKERRTALISAAVTGKIDVRDWVAPDICESEASQEATA